MRTVLLRLLGTRIWIMLMRLARHVTLPQDDAGCFIDVLERCIDQDLKRIYSLADSAARPSMALAAVSKTVDVWSDQVCYSFFPDESKSELIPVVKRIILAAAFFSQASIDLIKFAERLMLASVTARRTLWLMA